jgi:alanine racemase
VNFQLSIKQFAQIIAVDSISLERDVFVSGVVYDTRKIFDGNGKVFFALKGKYRDGIAFVEEAYQKGIRVFVLDELPEVLQPDAAYLKVDEPLDALMKLASWHRNQFKIPVIAIIGTHGKTTIKEWLATLLKQNYQLVKSPKSYNSKLGVALSLLGLHEEAEIAVFEASLTHEGDGNLFNELIKPTHSIVGHVGDKFNENFTSNKDKAKEYKSFLKDSKVVFSADSKAQNFVTNEQELIKVILEDQTSEVGLSQKLKAENAAISKRVASHFEITIPKAFAFSDVVMRLETFDGINDSLIINDTYSLDMDSLEAALQYQRSVAKSKRRVLFLPKDLEQTPNHDIKNLINRFHPIDCHYLDSLEIDPEIIQESVVLVKGNHGAFMNSIAHYLKLKHHRTKINVDLSALRKNIHLLKGLLPENTMSLIMVKANAYGTGIIKTASFVEGLGVDYLGVAYTDEGVALRKSGVVCPILVMSPGPDDFQDCISYDLEPSIFSLQLLDDFIKVLILKNRVGFPIHLKIDSGMHRLGISPEDIPSFIDVLNSQPEFYLKGVYSHFSESDNWQERSFTKTQLQVFEHSCATIASYVSYPFLKHIANSAAIINYPEACLDMVRMGLVVYGVTSNTELSQKLKPVIEWRSEVVQVKTLKCGDSIGYNRSFTADVNMEIAVIPVGYGDGFRRSLGAGRGHVFIEGVKCKTLGNICMDMLMVDITGKGILEGTPVEIIGKNQTLANFAAQLDTIPYEVLTSLSSRVHRNYIVS